MALVVKDRVKQTTTTTGTGTLTLNGTLDGFQTFAAALSDGDTTYYALLEPSTNNWEVGLGTWTEGSSLLARTTVLASSNSGSAVNLTAQAEVFITQPASKAAFFNADGDLELNRDPQTALQAATKEYVDTIAAAGLHYHDPVRVEQEGNLSATYNNGTAGVGATLTNNSTQAALVIDGVTLSTADRVLVYEQTDATQNGVYTVTNTGSASTNWVLTRSTDTDSYAPSDPNSFGKGDAFFVLEGNAGAGELYVMNTEGTITFGTTNITFTQVASTAVYSAGNGVTLTGTVFAADAGTGVTVDGSGINIGQAVETTSDVTFNSVAAALTGNVSGNVTGDVTGNADTATALETARNIGGVSFDGTASINLPGVNTTGNQDTTGNAATATAWETGRTISLTGDVTGSVTGVDGTGNASITTTIQPNSVALGTDTTGNYVATVTSGNYLTGGTTGEGSTPTLNVAATPNNTAYKVVARDASGNFSAGTVTVTGIATTGDITFGDNDKATFGASSDLRIYHNGSNSYIDDTGVGSLFIRSDDIRINKYTGEFMLRAEADGPVELYYDNSKKLETTSTGIDVTGTVVADGLEVDISSSGDVELTGAVNSNAGLVVRDPTATSYGAHFSYDDANTRVTIGGKTNGTKNTSIAIARDSGAVSLVHGGSTKLATTSTGINVTGTVVADGLTVETAQGDISIANSSSSLNFARAGSNYLRATDAAGSFHFITGASDFATQRASIGSNGDISFYEDTGTTAKFFWDASAESLGIGTSSPDYRLEVEEAGTGSGLGGIAASTATAGGSAGYRWATGGTTRFGMTLIGSAGSESLRIYDSNNSTERMRIDSSGNVGIGTSSPSSTLDVVGDIEVSGTVDGRDVAADGTKLDGIEAGATADQTAAQILTALKTVDGAGSGLNADFLDGVSSGGFARYDASGTLNNSLSNAAWVANYTSSTNVDHVWHDEAANAWNFNSDSTYKGTANSRVNAGSFYAGGNVVWNAGNDGSGSGLDADLLDGIDSASFLRSDVADTATKITFGQGNVTAPSPTDSSTGARIILYPSGSGRDYALGIESSTMWFNSDDHYKWYVDGSLKFEWDNTAGQLEVGGNKVWHAGNDGSGSGLDADLWDGQQFSSYLNQSVTTTANVTHNRVIGTDYVYSPTMYLGGALYHIDDTDTNITFGTNTITLATGGSSEITVNTIGVRLGDTGNGYFQPVSGTYGSVQIDGGAHNGWEGYNIGGRAVFMHDNNSTMGLFNDVDDEWAVKCVFNGAVNLYYNGDSKLDTLSNGVSINGNLYTDGSNAEDYDALSGTSPTCNVDNAGAFSLTMTGNTTFTFSGADSGWSMGFILQLTGNGSTVTWPASVKWAGGTAPDAPASGETDILVFHTRDGGSNWYGVLSSDAAA